MEYNDIKERAKKVFDIDKPFELYLRKSPITKFEKDENVVIKENLEYEEIIIDTTIHEKEEEMLLDFYRNIHLNTKYDIKDRNNHWYTGELLNCDGRSYNAHFHGFSDNCDECMYKNKYK